jgi:hypothetical protein
MPSILPERGKARGAVSSVAIFLRGHVWLTAFMILAVLGAVGAVMKRLESSNISGSRTGRSSSWLSGPPSPTPQLSKEYIYAGSRLLAVEDANANASPPGDLAVWRPSTGVWYVLGGPGSAQTSYTWGQLYDVPAPGDFDGDGKTDFSVFRPSTYTWYIVYSSSSSQVSLSFGATGDLPAVADYDGDGKSDAAVFRQSNYTWYIQGSTVGYYSVTWGGTTDKPAPADYDGDGRADICVWRDNTTTSTFYSINSSNNAQNTINFSYSGEPSSSDYDGDGRGDYAVFKDSASYFYIRQSSDAQTVSVNWGASGDKAVVNDYDGDGKTDVAVWRPSTGYWYIRQSASGNSLRSEWWGQSGDIPVPAYYRR